MSVAHTISSTLLTGFPESLCSVSCSRYRGRVWQIKMIEAVLDRGCSQSGRDSSSFTPGIRLAGPRHAPAPPDCYSGVWCLMRDRALWYRITGGLWRASDALWNHSPGLLSRRLPAVGDQFASCGSNFRTADSEQARSPALLPKRRCRQVAEGTPPHAISPGLNPTVRARPLRSHPALRHCVRPPAYRMAPDESVGVRYATLTLISLRRSIPPLSANALSRIG